MKTQEWGWKRGLLAVAALGLAGAVFGPMVLTAPIEASSSGEPAAKIAWSKDYRTAEAAARKSGKPLLVEFYADWCPPCRLMEQTTFQDAKVVELTRKFTPVRVDLDENQALARRFQVSGIPQAFILSPTGEVLARNSGYQDAGQFAAFLRQDLAAKGAR